MKLYKYRELTPFRFVEQILRKQAFWAARPDTLNDPEEFAWSCDYKPTPRTALLLAQVLQHKRGKTAADALFAAHQAVEGGTVEAHAGRALRKMQHRSRDEFGLICFGTSDDHPCLWQRYGGDGDGVCIEIEAEDHLLGTQLHEVDYATQKRLHVDEILEATLELGDAPAKVLRAALYTKPIGWQQEQEVRFVSKRQGVEVRLNSSPVTSVVLGDRVSKENEGLLRELVAALPYRVALRQREQPHA